MKSWQAKKVLKFICPARTFDTKLRRSNSGEKNYILACILLMESSVEEKKLLFVFIFIVDAIFSFTNFTSFPLITFFSRNRPGKIDNDNKIRK